jgi:hypothetical protein
MTESVLGFMRAVDGFLDNGLQTPEIANGLDDIAGEDIGFELGREGEDHSAEGIVLWVERGCCTSLYASHHGILPDHKSQESCVSLY